jgi:hypothetical protein
LKKATYDQGTKRVTVKIDKEAGHGATLWKVEPRNVREKGAIYLSSMSG